MLRLCKYLGFICGFLLKSDFPCYNTEQFNKQDYQHNKEGMLFLTVLHIVMCGMLVTDDDLAERLSHNCWYNKSTA
jgi:hypothetical protein